MQKVAECVPKPKGGKSVFNDIGALTFSVEAVNKYVFSAGHSVPSG